MAWLRLRPRLVGKDMSRAQAWPAGCRTHIKVRSAQQSSSLFSPHATSMHAGAERRRLCPSVHPDPEIAMATTAS